MVRPQVSDRNSLRTHCLPLTMNVFVNQSTQMPVVQTDDSYKKICHNSHMVTIIIIIAVNCGNSTLLWFNNLTEISIFLAENTHCNE